MSEPLTPPGCDLRGLPFMPLHVIRLADSDLAAISTGDEFKAAVMLWAKSWLQIPAASLPDDDRVLAHLSGANGKWRKVRDVALRGFVKCSDGRLYHPLIAEEAVKAFAERVHYAEKRDKDRERLADWRDKKRERKRPKDVDETQAKRVSVPLRNADETSKTGTGTGNSVPLDKSNGAAPASDARFWADAKSYLGGSNPGGLVGKWCRDFGKDATAKAITAAQIERAVDPVSYVTKALMARGEHVGENGVGI